MRAERSGSIHVLFVCTAGRCRSPIAAALLEQRLRPGSRVTVGSRGLKFAGEPMPPIGVSLMAEYGLNLSNHVSSQVTAQSAAEAGVILGLTREHVREVVAMSPEVWPKTFTFKDFVRRAERVGARRRHQRLADWLESVGADREPRHVLGADPEDDVIDPIGRRVGVWKKVVDEIDELVTRIVPALGEPTEPDLVSRRRSRG